MADLTAAGKAVLDGFLAKLPEDLRGPATEMFSKTEAQTAIQELGNAALRQSDYSRQMDEAAKLKAQAENLGVQNEQWRGKLAEWQKANQARLALGEAAEAAGWTPDGGGGTERPVLQTPKPAELPADLVRAADLDNRERIAVGYMNAASKLTLRHFKEFGDVLDIDELLTDPRVTKLGIQGVYDAKYGPQLVEKQQARQAEDAKKREEEIRADERRRLANRPITPVPGQDTSPLAALEAQQQQTSGKGKSAEELAQIYSDLVAARS